MRALVVLGCMALCGCWNFSGEFSARCSDGRFTDHLEACDAGVTGGGGGGGGAGGDGGGSGAAQGATKLWAIDGGCFGEGRWCWEYPGPVSNTLFAVSGTSDDDVYFAGSGRTLGRYDGTNFFNLAPLLPPEVATRPDNEPIFTHLLNTAEGVWLIGTGVGLMVSDGGPFARVDAGAGDWDQIASSDGFVYLARDGQLVVPTDGGRSIRPMKNPDGGLFGTVTGLLVDSNACVVTTHAQDTGFQDIGLVFDCSGSRGVLLDAQLSDHRRERFSSVFRLADGGIAVATEHGSVFEGGDGTAWSESRIEPFARMDGELPILSASRTSAGTLVCGGGGRIANVETGDVSRDGYDSKLWSSWVSPQGTFWASGESGALLSLDSVTTFRTVLNPFSITAAWVSDSHQLAVGRGFVHERTVNGKWEPRRARGVDAVWVGVTMQGETTWLVNEHGEVSVQQGDVALTELGSLGQEPDGGPLSRAVALPTRDGGVLIATAGRLTMATASGFAAMGDGGELFPEDITALGEFDGGYALTTNSDVYLSNDGQMWTHSFTAPNELQSLSVCPDGKTAYLVGNGGYWASFTLDGVASQNLPRAPMPGYVSVWCGADGVARALFDNGIVQPDLTQSTYERTGWGLSREFDSVGRFIGGTSNRLFIMGTSGAVISRPLP